MSEKENNPFISSFTFKNKETEKEVIRVISQNEGVLPEQVDRYLNHAYGKKKAKIMIELKHLLESFYNSNPSLSFSEFKGLLNMVLTEMHLERIKKADKFQADMIKKIKGVGLSGR